MAFLIFFIRSCHTGFLIRFDVILFAIYRGADKLTLADTTSVILVFTGVLAALFVGLKNLRKTIEPVVLMLIPDQPGWCAAVMQIL